MAEFTLKASTIPGFHGVADHGHGRGEASRHADKEQAGDDHREPDGPRRRPREDEDDNDRDEADRTQDTEFVVLVGEPSKPLHTEECAGAAKEVDQRKLGLAQARIGHNGRRHEGNDAATCENEQAADREGAEMNAVGENVGHLPQWVGVPIDGLERGAAFEMLRPESQRSRRRAERTAHAIRTSRRA